MDLFNVEVEFECGKDKGQVWIFCNLNLIQVLEIHESFSLRIIRESNIFVRRNQNQSKRIPIEELIYNI